MTAAGGGTPLSDAAVSGNSHEFAKAYDRYAASIYGLLLRILRDAEDARDILQETFLQAWSNARRFDPTRGSELAWLITMARSRALDRIRSRERRERREEAAGMENSPASGGVEESGEEVLAIRELRSAVVKAMGELPEPQKKALELAYFEGLSQSEIAARLDEPLGTIKTRTQLAMKRLRSSLSPYRWR